MNARGNSGVLTWIPPMHIAPCSGRFYMQESSRVDVESILANLLVGQGLSTEPRAVSSCATKIKTQPFSLLRGATAVLRAPYAYHILASANLFFPRTQRLPDL